MLDIVSQSIIANYMPNVKEQRYKTPPIWQNFFFNTTQNIEAADTAVSGFCFLSGETGIRTLGPASWSTVFETAPIDHSGISPISFLVAKAGAKVLLFSDMAKVFLSHLRISIGFQSFAIPPYEDYDSPRAAFRRSPRRYFRTRS